MTPAQVVDFAARMKVSGTDLVWSVLAVSMDWIGQVMVFIVGVLSCAFNRTYLGGRSKQLLIIRVKPWADHAGVHERHCGISVGSGFRQMVRWCTGSTGQNWLSFLRLCADVPGTR